MSQPSKANRVKTEVNLTPQPRVSSESVKPITFDDLVIDGSLTPVKVRVRSAEPGGMDEIKRFGPDDELLIELQCEV